MHQPSYEKNVYQFLSFYRFMTYALAVGLILLPAAAVGGLSVFQTYLLFALLGIYTIGKVFAPFRLYQTDLWTYIILGGDLAICVALLLVTGGLRSGFLLYSLSPVISAALLFEQRTSLAVATVTSLSLVAAHLFFSRWGGFVWVLEGNWLSMLLVYIALCFLIATIPYRVNLNIYRRIESDALLGERHRISRETHDGVAQSLGFLRLGMEQLKGFLSSRDMEQALDKVEEMKQVVQDAYEDVRESIDSLSMGRMSNVLLTSSLADYLQSFQRRTGIHTEFIVSEAQPRLSPMVELQLLRIVQEALTNVRKHAQASKVVVKLENRAGEVELVVRDNGRGFSQGEQQDLLQHHGLSIMKERAEILGGELSITSSEEGTEVKVTLAPGAKVRM
jgi:signal transduction histidine kinase